MKPVIHLLRNAPWQITRAAAACDIEQSVWNQLYQLNILNLEEAGIPTHWEGFENELQIQLNQQRVNETRIH